MHQVDCGVNFAMVVDPVKRIRGSKGFHCLQFGLGAESELEKRIHQLDEISSEPGRHLVLYIPRAMGY